MTNWKRVFSCNLRGAIDPAEIHKTLGLTSSTIGAWYAGSTSSGDLVDLSGNSRTLADSGSPVIGKSTVQSADGNSLYSSTLNGSTDYYSLAHASWMNMFSASHTLTIITACTASGGYLFCHGEASVSGLYISTTASTFRAVYSKSGGTSVASSVTVAHDGKYHILHLVRSGNLAKLFLDGVHAGSVDVTDYGIDGSKTLYLGCYDGAAAQYTGSVLYCRLNNAAMTDAQVSREVSIWRGAGVGASWSPLVEFRRAGLAMQTYGASKTMSLRSNDAPRIGNGFLVEGACTNLFGAASQRNVDSGWTKYFVTSTLNSGTGPDGTAYLDKLLETNDNNYHGIYQTQTLANGTTYNMSCIVQLVGRTAVSFVDDLAGSPTIRTFDLATMTISRTDAPWTGGGIEPLSNGCYRLNANIVGTGAARVIGVYASNSTTNDPSYAGDVAKGVIVGDMVLCAASQVSSITDPSTGARVADSASIAPYKLRNTLKDTITTAPTLWLDFDTTPSGATITDKGGVYTLTKYGTPKRYTDTTYGDYHLFDGTNDYYTSTIGNPSGDFSVSAVIVPNTIAAGIGVIASKWNATGDKRGWVLYRDGSSVTFMVSTDGASGTTATVSSALVAYKPAHITATYSTTGGLTLRVDALSASTSALTGAAYATNAAFYIGESAGGDGKFNGKMCYLAYYDGTALSSGDHSTMYSTLKQPGILPISVGSSSHYTQVRVRGLYKLSAASQTGVLFDIGGSIGASDTDTNRLLIDTTTTTFKASLYANGESTQRYMSKTGCTQNQWNAFDVIFPMSDLTTASGTFNGAAMTLDASMTGAKTLSLLDTKINIGHDYAIANHANGMIVDLDIFVA